jgi:hypothetical protein
MDELNADGNITDNLPCKSSAAGINGLLSRPAASRDLVFAIKSVPPFHSRSPPLRINERDQSVPPLRRASEKFDFFHFFFSRSPAAPGDAVIRWIIR